MEDNICGRNACALLTSECQGGVRGGCSHDEWLWWALHSQKQHRSSERQISLYWPKTNYIHFVG